MLPLYCQEQIVFYAVYAGYDGLCSCICKEWKRWASEVVRKDRALLLKKIDELSLKGFGYGRMFDSAATLEDLQLEYQKIQWKMLDALDQQAWKKQKRIDETIYLGVAMVFSILSRGNSLKQ